MADTSECPVISHISRGMQGMVSLVGAGPGDPDLLTMKACRLLQQAEVVVYDRLVSPEVMAMVNPSAEQIYVGKKLDYHIIPQGQINQILAEHARRGKHVVRLKGGDPFIFGRGGEEIEYLADQQIRFEIVPGITAAAGATAYAGIPLTHRDYSQGVEFITGHIKQNGDYLCWSSLAQSNHTLVFYMGLKQSGYISEQLLLNGLDSSTSCAIIEKGTTPQQKVFLTTLVELPQAAKQAESPALIVVGGVTKLHEKLQWYSAG
ncbi:uroporphyrinogen-III C-methyltransferase [Vibrio sp. HA2012]|uniref:uroporphyrinogen-III C-methyltransferase n=1 Tax=Vibrio sp. HA2012 TaxID=1971595 RepID=UPI000C2C291C|nr:uroporphyrinogen-III C-methyltransferase [Vibrio sp. HA2012]PJC87102.1 uroporphyrinogen-III C-methyltransferase [Vibrio sp. HA2012]